MVLCLIVYLFVCLDVLIFCLVGWLVVFGFAVFCLCFLLLFFYFLFRLIACLLFLFVTCNMT